LSRPSFLVLGESGDALAQGVAAAMRSATARADDVLWLTPTNLVRARWEHRVSTAGARTRVFVSGEWHALDGVVATLNRLRWLPASGTFTSDDDADYAASERHALVISALHGLSGVVVNPPAPPSLSGPDLTPAAWLRLAARLGLPVREAVVTTDGRRHPRGGWQPARWPSLEPEPAGLPIGERPVVWLAPMQVTGRCWVVGESTIASDGSAAEVPGLDMRSLARAARCQLLEVLVGRGGSGRMVLAAVDPFPVDLPTAVHEAVLALLVDGRLGGPSARATGR